MAHGLVRLVHDAAALAGDESRGEHHGKPWEPAVRFLRERASECG